MIGIDTTQPEPRAYVQHTSYGMHIIKAETGYLWNLSCKAFLKRVDGGSCFKSENFVQSEVRRINEGRYA